MKNKIKKFISITGLAIGLLSCHDLEVPVTTEMTPNVFPTDQAQFVQASGTVYAALRGNYALDYWFVQTLSTDEAILPARGTNWLDGGKYQELHYHTWTAENAWINSVWSWLSLVIGHSNQTLTLLEPTNIVSEAIKTQTLAEIRAMRAYAYFLMMDMFGNVPLVTTYGDFTIKPNATRAQVFDFIESELNEIIPSLSDDVSQSTYGRPTKFMAYALLAKMYLNSGIYTSPDVSVINDHRLNDCIAACDAIINSGKYSIETRANYLNMFYPNNGPATKEFIFAIPYDPTVGVMPNTNGYMYRARYELPNLTAIRTKYGLPFTPSGPESTTTEFFEHFDNDVNDIRNDQWLTGTVYANDGTTPIVTLSRDIELLGSVEGFDVGNNATGWAMGYRNNKFYADATSTTRNQNNDVPVFRYSDIILMKAEAILRGGTPTGGATALDLVNQVRANRSTSTAWTTVTLEDLYSERSREFVAEAWHRNDMIRFGHYEDAYTFKTNTEKYRRVFPIPTIAFRYNTMLSQNTGY